MSKPTISITLSLMLAMGCLVPLAQAQPLGPEPARLKATVEKLVSFGTRHTLSSATDPKRGIGAARRWAADEFRAISRKCGGCLTVEMVSQRFDGPRAPDGVDVVDVIAIQKGSGDPRHVVIVAGHIDSRVSDVMDFTSDAPGANDDGSGSALVIEAARVLSAEKFTGTIVYALLSGEEQGLWGGELLAKTAKERGWNVAAMLNNDIVGNIVGQNGAIVDQTVRVFSEGIRSSEDLRAAMARRGMGGEDDSSSRALAKTVDRIAMNRPDIGLDVFAVRRPDRFGRGGDHTPLLAAGYPAVRFSVGAENYDQQHQDIRTESGREFGDTVDKMDFSYLARVTALNIATLRILTNAPPAPENAYVAGAVSTDSTVTWAAVTGASAYRVYWRRNDTQDWSNSRIVTDGTQIVLKDIIVDDNFFAVAAISPTGAESIPVFAGMAPRN